MAQSAPFTCVLFSGALVIVCFYCTVIRWRHYLLYFAMFTVNNVCACVSLRRCSFVSFFIWLLFSFYNVGYWNDITFLVYEVIQLSIDVIVFCLRCNCDLYPQLLSV